MLRTYARRRFTTSRNWTIYTYATRYIRYFSDFVAKVVGDPAEQ